MLVYEQVINIEELNSPENFGEVRQFSYIAGFEAYAKMVVRWMEEFGDVQIKDISLNKDSATLIILFNTDGKEMLSVSQEIDPHFNTGIDKKAVANLTEKLVRL